MRTRLIELAEGQDRRAADNLATAAHIGRSSPLTAVEPADAVALLTSMWPRVHKAIAAGVGPGVSVVAVDRARRRIGGSMWIAAKPGAINAGVIGRHGHCDLFLDGDAAMSLRHLVVIVDPARDWGGVGGAEIRYRLLDLRTSTAFVDEEGRRLEAITALGPAFVFVGRYILYCFPTGVDDWPAEASAAMAAMPERIYIDDRDAEPDRWQRRRPMATGTSNHAAAPPPSRDSFARSSPTIVTAVPGPARARIELAPDDLGLGRLEIRSQLGSDVVPVGVDAARRGMLLGRYSRCDSAGAVSLALGQISRVHVLVLAIEGALWMIDAASTNGITADGKSVRVQPLHDGAEIELAGVGTVRWFAAN